MQMMKQSLAINSHSYENVLLWAACCVGFFGFLSCAQFLTPDDVPFNPQVHLCLSDLVYRHAATAPYRIVPCGSLASLPLEKVWFPRSRVY